MPLLDHFGWLAPRYDRWASPRKGEILGRFLKPEPIGWLLDAGGGTGRAGESLRDRAGQVIVLDESWLMVQQARRKPGLLAVNSEAERMPFPASSFDAILMVDAFHHLSDQPEAVRELLRVCKPGGTIVIEEPDIRRLAVKAIAVAEKLMLMRSHICSGEEIADLFSQNGTQAQVYSEGLAVWVVIQNAP
jgi:demethylmenaquinone methyltransferase/2-methoxy-6-polyprenyl-1,4-benzoquinol methylase